MGGVYDEISSIQQSVTISAGAPYRVYWQWIDSNDACNSPGPNDFGKVLINGSVIDTYPLCDATSTNDWVTHSVNLSAYACQSFTIQIRAETNGATSTDTNTNSNLFVDDVSLQATAAASAGNVFVPSRVPAAAQTKPGIIP